MRPGFLTLVLGGLISLSGIQCFGGSVCGNGDKEEGEECDYGGKTGGRCRPDCRWRRCGDGVLDTELSIDTDNDGLGDVPEVCDWGIDGGPPCRRDCRSTTFCGNAIVDGTDVCDDGNTVDGDGCDTNCTLTACGNGVQTAGEACDRGERNSNTEPGSCRTDCTLMQCGDAILDPGEECDDGNLQSGDGCDSNCTHTRCGNGAVSPDEECDDQNAFNTDACLNNCRRNDCSGGRSPEGEPCFRLRALAIPDGDPRGVVIADVDGDGFPDVVTADRGDDTVKIFWGSGGNFSGPQEEWVAPGFTIFGDRPVDVAAGDLDGDGQIDLVTANEMGDRVCILENAGGRDFRKHAYEVGNFPTGVEVAELDGQQGLEIAVALSNEKEIRIWRPSSTFSSLTRVQTIGTYIPSSLSVGDLGGDGDLDLAWSAALVRDVTAYPYVAIHGGTGLSESAVENAEPQSLTVGLWRLGGTSAATVVAGVYGLASPHLRVFAASPFDVSTQKWPVHLAQAGSRGAYADNGGTFGVFRIENGSLVDERLFTYEGDAQGLAAGDLDRDGAVDLVISSPERKAVLVFLGRAP